MTTPAVQRTARRDAGAHQAILAATLDLLDEVGYAATTIEGVAQRAGVGKTTIYRWWPSKGSLVGEALATRLSKGPEPETGDLRRDLMRTIRVTANNYTGPGAELVLVAFAAHVERDPDLLRAFREDFLAERRRHGKELLDHAAARGELPSDADTSLIMDIWAGTILYRALITGEIIDDDLPAKLVDLLLEGRVPRRSQPAERGRKTRASRTEPTR